MATIAQKLKNSRIKVGLTQSEAAERMGIHRNSLLNYEKGRREPNAKLINRFAQLYGVDVDWLSQSEDAFAPVASNAFLDKYELLSDNQKRIIAELIDEFSNGNSGVIDKIRRLVALD